MDCQAAPLLEGGSFDEPHGVQRPRRGSNTMEALRQIPPVSEILRSQELREFRSLLSQPFVGTLLDEIFKDIRRELTSTPAVVPRAELTLRIAQTLALKIRQSLSPSLRRVINASGVVLHTNLGRAPLPAAAIDHLREVSTGYSNLEFDLEHGARGKRDVHVSRLLQQLLGCEAAVVVNNNNAAAVLLVLNTLGEGGEVIASRGEQVEIGESFRIPEIMRRAGRVCGKWVPRIARASRITKRHQRADAAAARASIRAISVSSALPRGRHWKNSSRLGRKRQNIPTFEDLGSGCSIDTSGRLVSR